jgi:hypothetical protein
MKDRIMHSFRSEYEQLTSCCDQVLKLWAYVWQPFSRTLLHGAGWLVGWLVDWLVCHLVNATDSNACL